ncbi:MAG: hypothetical protein IPG58_16975 [Acidobacteria bacterium]|nr:hypothetical protein [Acidobacteriota bacterium]
MNQGKFVEAERLIDEMPESNRRSALIMLATRAFAKDPKENKTYSLSVLQKVRGLLSDKPTDQNELSQFIQLTAAYAPIEPGEAFGTFEPVIPMLNELSDASSIVQGFRESLQRSLGRVCDGEQQFLWLLLRSKSDPLARQSRF